MIPSKVRLGHRSLDVFLTELDDDRIGEYSYRHGEVRIAGQLKPDIQAVTLLHEIFHHVLAESGRNASMTPEDEEGEVTFWASAVSQLIADNPAIAVYLLKSFGEE